MISLETMLPADEMTSFNGLVSEATAKSAGAVVWHSPTSGVLVVGFCHGGELLTWFATPAATEVEAIAARSVIFLGVAQASLAMNVAHSGAYDAASAVIKKAMH